MSKPIGYFTACPHGYRLVQRFGDADLAQLSQLDQAALIVALSGFVLSDLAAINGEDMVLSLDEAAGQFIPEAYQEYTSSHFVEAIAILMGINSDDATDIIHFLTQ